MKKLLLAGYILFSIGFSYAQTELKATMGINFVSIPSVQDYINQSYQPIDEVGTFSSAVIFTVEVGQFLSSNFQLGLEFPYQIYSYPEAIKALKPIKPRTKTKARTKKT